MVLAHRAALGGVQLDEIDPRIIIKGIDIAGGKETVTTTATGRGDGTRITGKRRDSVEIGITFSMNIRRNALEERVDLLERICAWALGGGWLTISYKPDRRIWIDEVETPGEGDIWKRLTEYTLVLRARAVPFWTQETAVSASTGAGGSGSGVLQVGGNRETVVDAQLANVSGALINTASITIGGNTMTFEGLGLGAGETLAIWHELVSGKEILRIRIGSRSVMAARTAGSADEFTARPGNMSYRFSAQRACQLTVSCRGRFA